MTISTTVAIIGGGPTGLSAAAFLTRANVDCVVLDQGRSTLTRAMLNNYCGTDSIEGRPFLENFRSSTTCPIIKSKVTNATSQVGENGTSFLVDLEAEEQVECQYIIIATGQGNLPLEGLGLQTVPARQPYVSINVCVDQFGKTSVEGVWAAGVAAGWPSQAIVCAGSGANVAIEVISVIRGEFYVDHDNAPRPPAPQ